MTLPLQESNRSYGTGIGTTDIRQAEFDSGEWQTVSGGFRMYSHSILLIYRKIMHTIRNNNVLMQKNCHYKSSKMINGLLLFDNML